MGDTRYDNIENWQSHIAGNHSHKYAYVPTCEGRYHILQYAEAYILSNNLSNKRMVDKSALCEITKILERPTYIVSYSIINSLKDTFLPYTTGNRYSQFTIKLDKYIENVKKIETWDYWTYGILGNTFEEIINSKSQIMTMLSDTEIKKYVTGALEDKPLQCSTSGVNISINRCITQKFYNMFFDDNIRTTTYLAKLKESVPIGYEEYRHCLKEINGLVEMFAPYIERGLSTPEIARMMGSSIQTSLRKAYLLMNALQEFKKMTPEERAAGVDDLVHGIEKSLRGIIPALSESDYVALAD